MANDEAAWAMRQPAPGLQEDEDADDQADRAATGWS